MKKLLQVYIAALCLLAAPFLTAQANGNLQLHFIDTGQGDAAILISPGGQIVLFDDGALKNCDKPVSYLQQLGITHIDFHINSHFHADHFGCASQVFGEFGVPKVAYDRGGTYASSQYTAYITLIGNHRKKPNEGEEITLDTGTAHQVKIKFVALNGNHIDTTNENDLSLVSLVTFGNFKAEFGGDLSGFDTDNYKDIETSVAPLVGPINVYKVHHHCSRYSTNDTWLTATKPQIGIVSVGDGNTFGHPTAECLERLHQHGVKTFWTENGNGGDPDPAFDTIAGNIIVEVVPNASSYTVRHGTTGISFPIAGGGAPGPATTPTPAATAFAWSKKSSVYHFANCKFVDNISPDNLQTGSAPPAGKTLHKGCPR
jgi:beta-lactamase superfamily II metal-dependent hydrolase